MHISRADRKSDRARDEVVKLIKVIGKLKLDLKSSNDSLESLRNQVSEQEEHNIELEVRYFDSAVSSLLINCSRYVADHFSVYVVF